MAATEARRCKAVSQAGAGAQHEKTTAKQRPVSMSLEHEWAASCIARNCTRPALSKRCRVAPVCILDLIQSGQRGNTDHDRTNPTATPRAPCGSNFGNYWQQPLHTTRQPTEASKLQRRRKLLPNTDDHFARHIATVKVGYRSENSNALQKPSDPSD